VARAEADGLIAYRFRAPGPRRVSARRLRRSAITAVHSVLLVSTGAHVTSSRPRG
jgi:hypothetical protein